MNCCPRCNREVYFAERKVALGRVWHSFCFSCYKCRKLLDACSVHTCCDELYCSACFNSICDPCDTVCCCNPPAPCCCGCAPCCDPCEEVCCEPRPDCSCCKKPPPLKGCSSSDKIPCKLSSCCGPRCKSTSDPYCPPPCNSRDVCDPCTRLLPCKPCGDPFCSCCGKKPLSPRGPTTEHYSLRPTTAPKETTGPIYPCLPPAPGGVKVAEVAGTAVEAQMCETPSKIPPCCAQKAGSACAAPTPRETQSYYSRNHKKPIDSNGCKGSCYCPGDYGCAHKGFEGRFADPQSCDPCAIMDCCPNDCGCCKPHKCCSPTKRPGSKPPKCCPDLCDPCKCAPPKRASCCSPCRACSPCSRPEPCCAPCCPPYQPPCRKPICYPPINCCENDSESPAERICYYPCPIPPQPKYCTCGSPNPCDCDLNAKRRQAICEMSPCCRRCGRKVYAAEQIMASGGAFHSACFSCYSCHKPLEVTNVYENQGEIYCKQCYAKYFGMQGYGYGSTLLSPL